MLNTVKTQLAIDLCCAVEDFDREGFVFCVAKDHPQRRPFPRGEQKFDMLTMGKAVIVSASAELLPWLKTQLGGVARDEAFSMPFVYGHSLFYLPDPHAIKRLPCPEGFTLEIVEREAIPALYAIQGFTHAIQYDVHHPRPDVLTVLAKKDGVVVGMAGASEDCRHLWQIGIDVLPAYRGHHLAVALVNRLTLEIMDRGIVPYYGTASSNIGSQRVAHRAGLMPAWMCSYQGRFGDHRTDPQ